MWTDRIVEDLPGLRAFAAVALLSRRRGDELLRRHLEAVVRSPPAEGDRLAGYRSLRRMAARELRRAGCEPSGHWSPQPSNLTRLFARLAFAPRLALFLMVVKSFTLAEAAAVLGRRPLVLAREVAAALAVLDETPGAPRVRRAVMPLTRRRESTGPAFVAG